MKYFLIVIYSFAFVQAKCIGSNSTIPDEYEYSNSDSVIPSNKQSYFKELSGNLLIQLQSPLKINKHNIGYVAAGAVTITGFCFLDQSIDNNIRPLKTNSKFLSVVSSQVTELGGQYGLGFVALFAGFSFISQNQKSIETTRLLSQSLISITIWSRLGKLITCRQRPMASYTNHIDAGGEWYGPFESVTKIGKVLPQSSFDAFPSGHTSTAFAIATVFAIQYKEHPLVPVISYALASIVGITRMIEHEHWASDVLAGGLLGYLCSKQICNNSSYHKRHDNQCYLNLNKSQFTVGYSMRF